MMSNPFFHSACFAGKKIHLGVTGSIAAYKAAELLRMFLHAEMPVSSTLTRGAREFVSNILFAGLGASPVYGDMFEDGEVFSHLQPGRESDVMLVAPASADFLARMANGLGDDMLAAQYLAFSGPVVIAPAMNPRMWENMATRDNINKLRNRGHVVVEPDTGAAACGEEGKGRLRALGQIFLETLKAMSPADMSNKKVLVTLGPTRESWDGVRFWSNPSSGAMGVALATACWLRGAEVYAVSGPIADLCMPSGVHRINVRSAEEMHGEAARCWPEMDMGLFCAAVADFAPDAPEGAGNRKIKKNEMPQEFSIGFHRNRDILADLALERRNNQKVLGFAAEIAPDREALANLAQGKLAAKKADMIAGNLINPGNSAFGAETATMAVIDVNGKLEYWQDRGKADIAWDLVSWLLSV